jgi:OmpA-OmpF porin, OOP family
MSSQRTLLGLVLGLTAACTAMAQAQGMTRWRVAESGDSYGLQAERTDFRLHVQAGYVEPSTMDRVLGRTRTQGLNVKMVGKQGLANDLGIYGRLGTGSLRSTALMGGPPAGEGSGLTYGVGLSWDITPRTSAMLGWDSYDLRTLSGDRDLRGTSLGLQWRY